MILTEDLNINLFVIEIKTLIVLVRCMLAFKLSGSDEFKIENNH